MPEQLAEQDFIGKRISQQFALFQDHRKPEEEERIFNVVYERCISETIQFLEENLSPDNKAALLHELTLLSQSGKETDSRSIINIIETHLNTISQASFRLEARLNHLIDTIHYQAVKTQGGTNATG